jgi:hypothetical protein
MKKSIFAIWAIIVIFIGLVITQNQDFFLSDQSLRLNLWVLGEYATPILPNAVIFLVTFIAGLVITYLFCLPERFKSKRTIKKLTAKLEAYKDDGPDIAKEAKELQGSAIEKTDSKTKSKDISDDSPADETVEEKPASLLDNPDSETSDKQI